ncbi:hypothetical protein ABPG77_010668 [Micractinium sp. CCAP 211/92]
MAALMRAARQQGSLRLLACLADAPLAASALAADPAVLSQQQVAGLRTVAAVGWLGLASQAPLAAATAAPGRQLQAGPLGKQQQRLEQQQQLPHLLQQRHGMAMKVSGFRPKRRDQGPAERNLPARNEEITAPEVRVLYAGPANPEEQRSEVMTLRRALKMAKKEELDLVMVSPKAEPPVVRLTEWSKVLYEQQKREKAALKQRLAQQRAADAKEVRIGCSIAEHDLGVKMAQARRFLEDGHSLRLVVTFKGGQQIALGREVILYLIGQLADLAKLKDEKHLQRPMRGYWAVTLTPLSGPAAAKAKPSAKNSGSSNGGGAEKAGDTSQERAAEEARQQAQQQAEQVAPAAAA